MGEEKLKLVAGYHGNRCQEEDHPKAVRPSERPCLWVRKVLQRTVVSYENGVLLPGGWVLSKPCSGGMGGTQGTANTGKREETLGEP